MYFDTLHKKPDVVIKMAGLSHLGGATTDFEKKDDGLLYLKKSYDMMHWHFWNPDTLTQKADEKQLRTEKFLGWQLVEVVRAGYRVDNPNTLCNRDTLLDASPMSLWSIKTGGTCESLQKIMSEHKRDTIYVICVIQDGKDQRASGGYL